MRRFYPYQLLILTFVVASSAAADKNGSDLPAQAIAHSQITAPGSRPFRLKASIVESTNLDNDDYKAEVDEVWLAPDKWQRTVKMAGFSQTRVANGAEIR